MTSSRRKRPGRGPRLRRLFVFVLNLILYPLSGLAPRSADHWAFGHARENFAGNPKYLFLWMTIHRPDIHVTWLTGSEKTRRMLAAHGLRAHRRWSLRGVVAALRARVFVFAHGTGNVNVQLSRGALLLNLWHGVGIKAVGRRRAAYVAALDPSRRGGVLASLRARSERAIKRIEDLGYLTSPDILATTSDFMQAHFADQFVLPAERCPQIGYPRLDCAYDPALAEAVAKIDRGAGFSLNPDGFAEIYIYMPTYRDSRRPFIEEALPDLDRLSKSLAARNAMIYIKPHQRTAIRLTGEHNNIRSWPEDIDYNPYLAEFTGLITDYSSVLYDYLAVRSVGAILYTFDYDDYTSQDRSLLYPFEENVAGLRVSKFGELCDALREGRALDPALSRDVERIRERFWGGSPKPSSPAVVDHVMRQLGANA